MSRAKAIIFDCDGVLVDSELLGNRILAEVLTEHGLPTTTADSLRTYLGLSMPSVLRRAGELAGRSMAPCEGPFLARVAVEFERSLTAVAGMRELIASLACPIAVASSSPVPRLATSLRVAGMFERFAPHIYSADHVAHPKPAPDLFLHAASRLGVAPGECIVVEDGLAGIRGAHAAGMRCIAFGGGGHCDDQHVARLRESGAASFTRTASELAVLLRMLLCE